MRLFVAINFPAAVRDALWRAAEPLRRESYPVRWVDAAAMHLTLKFLGDVPEAREADVAAGLERAVEGARPFLLPLGGFGAFPPGRRPRVVWAGCDGVPPLELLQHQVERAMAALGFALEGKPFRPHVTLGRARDGASARDFAGFDAELDRLAFQGEVVVESVDLMHSTLSPTGARYAARRSVPLVG